ncbi:MoaB/Mog domain-containing protein [Parasitella parasitica]|nr:MoaB/Mog domain-containing protein [Parasitella parasitica]
MAAPYTIGILTVSDTASKDNMQDKSGPLIRELFAADAKYSVKEQAIVPDQVQDIGDIVKKWSDDVCVNAIVLTGGTGFSERDITPEAIKPLLAKETTGITHLLLSTSLAITPFAALSRPITGIRNKTLIITLPGSPKACKENMDAVFKVLPHSLDLILGRSVKKMHDQMQESQQKMAATIQSGGFGHTCSHRHDQQGHPSQTGVSASLDTPVSRRARSSPYPLIPVEEAHKIIAKHANTLNVISMPVTQFLPGYVLAEDVCSLEPVPGYRASIVDGYAIHVEDGPGVYEIESISLAQIGIDQDRPKTLSRGKVARVATGGMVYENANAVIMVEDTKLAKSSPSGDEEVEVEVLVSARPGDNIREVGSDCSVGQIVGHKGQCIGADLGVLASVGVRHVKVFRKPRVGVLSSGNEVLDHIHTDHLKPGQIRDTNRITLLAAIQVAGFEAVDLGIVDDNVDDIVERLEEATTKTDVLLTTGGVSMGEADFMKPILEQKLEATVHFGRVMMKPGKPTTFATIPQGPKRPPKLVFALPGNPVSATVGFHLFVLPALRRMAGWPKPENVLVPVQIQNTIQLDPRPEFHRVQVSISSQGNMIATSTGKQQSSRMLSMVEANGLLQLPKRTPEHSEVVKGTTVPCILIGALVNH